MKGRAPVSAFEQNAVAIAQSINFSLALEWRSFIPPFTPFPPPSSSVKVHPVASINRNAIWDRSKKLLIELRAFGMR